MKDDEKEKSDISIFDEHLSFNNIIFKGLLYQQFLYILQTGKIPSELIDILPYKVKVTDHRYQQEYNIELQPSLKARFDVMKAKSTSNFDMLMKESEQLRQIPIDLQNNNILKRSWDFYEQNKFNALAKKAYIENLEIKQDFIKETEQINMNMMYVPVNVSFFTQLNKTREILRNKQLKVIETTEENQVKSVNGFVIVQSIKFKSKIKDTYLTINLLSSQSADYFESFLYFGSQPDTIVNGHLSKVPIGPRSSIASNFDSLVKHFLLSWDMTFDSKLNISTPQARQISTPEVKEESINDSQYVMHKQRVVCYLFRCILHKLILLIYKMDKLCRVL